MNTPVRDFIQRHRRRAIGAGFGVAALAALSAATTVHLSAGAEAAAQPGSLVSCVKSDAGQSVHFQYRWSRDGRWFPAEASNDGWITISIPARESDPEGEPPELFVRYDDDPTETRHVVLQRLIARSAVEVQCDSVDIAKYVFRVRDGELFLDLERDDGLRGQESVPNNRQLPALTTV